MDVTAVVPTIPPRTRELNRALRSIAAQTVPVAATAIAYDLHHRGAGWCRNRALEMANTEWIAFLDDDDEWFPNHIERCRDLALEHGVDVVVPWFVVEGGTDPFEGSGCREAQVNEAMLQAWDETTGGMAPLHSFGITCLVRREAIGDVRFPQTEEEFIPKADHPISGEDYLFWVRLAQAGAHFFTTPEATWRWHHWGYGEAGMPGNTSGNPTRW